MVALLKDDERLKNERIRALKAKERFAQSTAGLEYFNKKKSKSMPRSKAIHSIGKRLRISEVGPCHIAGGYILLGF
jgi:hypothetical protein